MEVLRDDTSMLRQTQEKEEKQVYSLNQPPWTKAICINIVWLPRRCPWYQPRTKSEVDIMDVAEVVIRYLTYTTSEWCKPLIIKTSLHRQYSGRKSFVLTKSGWYQPNFKNGLVPLTEVLIIQRFAPGMNRLPNPTNYCFVISWRACFLRFYWLFIFYTCTVACGLV